MLGRKKYTEKDLKNSLQSVNGNCQYTSLINNIYTICNSLSWYQYDIIILSSPAAKLLIKQRT